MYLKLYRGSSVSAIWATYSVRTVGLVEAVDVARWSASA